MKTFLCSIVISLLLVSEVLAASDGLLGSSSSGTSVVSVTIPPLIRLSGIEDIDLGTWSGAESGVEQGTTICIYTNTSAAGYQVTATGSGAGGAFELQSAQGTIPFSVEWNDESAASGGSALSSGNTLAGQTGANTSSQDCGGGANAYLRANIDAETLKQHPTATYTGSIQVIVEPN